MPSIPLKYYLIGAGAIVILLIATGIYFSGRSSGAAVTEAKVAKEQTKTLQKVVKQNDKIDRSTPFDSSKSDAIKWLQQHSREAN